MGTLTKPEASRARDAPEPLRILAFMEAAWLSGPAKNLLGFAQLARPGATIEVATFQRGGVRRPHAFAEACERAGVPIHFIAERHAMDRGVLAQMHRLVEELQPDIVQTHSVKSHFLVHLARLARGRHWIAFHHGYTSTNRKMWVYNQLDRVSLPAADRVVTVCGAFASQLTSRGVERQRIRVRHNSVRPFVAPEEVAVERARRAAGWVAGTRTLLAVGRLSLEKGHADLLRAFALLQGRRPDPGLRLVLVGDGPERRRLENQAARAGLAPQVTFAGHSLDVKPFYRIADIVVLPSLSEGSPNVLLEAMAAGVPVACTAVGGVPEVATDGQEALLVPKGSPEALATALGRLLDDEGLRHRLGAQARVAAAARSPQEYCDSMLALYQELRAEGAGALAGAPAPGAAGQ